MNRLTLLGLLLLCMVSITGRAQSQLPGQMLTADPRNMAQEQVTVSPAAQDEAIRSAIAGALVAPAKPNEAEAQLVDAIGDEPTLIDGVRLDEWTGAAPARKAPRAGRKAVRMAEDATYIEFDYARKDGTRSVHGTPRIVLTGDTTAVVYNLWGLTDTLQATVNEDEGTISITPACVYTHSSYGEIWAASLTEDGYYSLKNPITGTVEEDGSITLSGWCLVIIAGDYKGYGYGFYSKSELKMPNATMENVNYDGTSVENTDSVYTYGVYIEQPYDNMLAITNLANYPTTVNVRLSSDSVATITPQTIFTNAFYGEFQINRADWATSKAAQKGNVVSTNVTPTEIDFGNWGIFNRYTTTLRSMGVISSRLIFSEGLFTYPEKRELDWSGDGTEASPYIITTAEQMLAFEEAVNGGESFNGKYIALGNDIDMSGITSAYVAIGSDALSFNGNFDGRGYAVKNLNIDYGVENYCGLFGYADSTSVIKNLTIDGMTLSCDGNYVGAVAGYSHGELSNLKVINTTITHGGSMGGGIIGMYYMGAGFDGGYFDGTISGKGATGGCIGMLQGATASHLESHGSVTLTGIADSFYRGLGGVVGYTLLRYKTYAKLTDSYNAALITSNSSYGYVGGVVGCMNTCDMERCYNTAPISCSLTYSSSATYYGYTGGISGMSYGSTLTDCYNAGTVFNSGYSPLVGGAVGYVLTPMKSTTTKDGQTIVTYSYESRLTNCYNSAQVLQNTNYDVQGFYGKIYNDSILTNCIYDFQTNGTVLPDSSTVIMMNTADMTSAKGIEGFSSDVWTFSEGFYPVLKNLAGTNEANFSMAPVTFATGDNVKQVKSAFTVSTDNGVTWKLYYNSSYVDESDGLVIDGNTVTLKNVNSSEILCAFDSNGEIIKLYRLNTLNPAAFDGSGTEDDPFLIRTKSDLLAINDGVVSGQAYTGLYFKQMNDIDVSADDTTDDFTGIGIGGKSTITFGGIYDGNGYSIHNFNVNTIAMDGDSAVNKNNSGIATALFGMVAAEGEIRNVTLASDCDIRAYNYAAGIAAVNYGKLYNCKNYANITVASQYAGGIVAAGQKGSVVEQCYNAGTITASGFYAGGIACATAGDVIYCQNDGEVKCDSIYPGTKWQNNGYASGIVCSSSGGITVKGNINTGRISARKYASGIAQSVAQITDFSNNINYGMVDETVTMPATRGTMLAYAPGTKETPNNYYDAQIGFYGAAATAAATGLNGILTREMTAGTALEAIDDADRFDWTAGLYPVIKAFKDEAPAVAHRKMVVTFGDEQTADDILNDAALYVADDLVWTTEKGVNFVPDGATLKVTLTEDTTSLRDVLTATVGEYTKIIPLRAMPKIFEGSGTKDDPFQIRTKEDMLKLAEFTNEQSYPFSNRYFIVLNDIDFDTTEYIVVGFDDASFNGDFDGNGKTFYNINNTIVKTQDCRGMFGNLGPNGVLHDFTLASGTITGYRYNGAIVGKCYGTVYNVTNYATVTTSSSSGAGAAGIAGQVYDGGLIYNCYNYGTITPSGMYGAGIAYKIYPGAVVDSCQNFADMETSKTGFSGIVSLGSGLIKNCINWGNITSGGNSAGIVAIASTGCQVFNCINHGTMTGKAKMAGVVASTSKPSTADADVVYVEGCYNDAAISGTGSTGGFIGDAAAGHYILNCYNTGTVTGTGTSAGMGGFIGNMSAATNYTSKIENCYNTGNVTTGSQYTGGFVGKTVSGVEFYNCHNVGDVYSTNKFVGGFGGNMSGYAYHCYNTGDVKNDNVGVGGFASIGSGEIDECFNLGNVTSTNGTQNGGVAGGLWGYGLVKMHNSYNMGDVKAAGSSAGLCGGIYNAFVADGCYNAGNVAVDDSTYLGNIAPNPLQNREGTFTNVYFDTEVNHGMPWSSIDSLCVGLNTSEMTQAYLSDAFQLIDGMYPTLTYFSDNALANWFAAVPVFSEGDNPTNVSHVFIVGTPDETEWACSDNLIIEGNNVYCTQAGEGWVTKTYVDPVTGKTYERTYYVNMTTKTTTGVNELTAGSEGDIVATTYYSVNGVNMGSKQPVEAGVYIRVDRYTSGKTASTKVMIK